MRMRSFPIAFAALGLLAAGCGAENIPAPGRDLQKTMNPIIGGTTDSGHPAVALIYNQTYGFICSGTIIAPTVMLTAGHCTITGSTFPGSGTAAASGYMVYGGTDPFGAGYDWARSVSEVHHPSNLIVNSSDIEHDVGILILSSAAPVTPMNWLSTHDDSAYTSGTPITLVGYGVDSDTDTTGQSAGVKRTLSTTITTEYTNGFEYGSTGSNTCEGDSGGPAISGGQEIGTTSFGTGGGACGASSVDMRTDFEAGFIKGFTNPSSGGSSKKGCGCDLGGDAAEALLPGLLAAGALAGAWRRRRVS